jgi:Flp pilus assembly protein TadD
MLGEAQKRCDGGQLREAADLLRQAAVIDPPNERVQGLLRVVLGRIELRRAKVADMVAEARRLWDANQFKEAINLLRQAVIFDPLDADAARLLFVALDKSDLGREIIPISGPRSAEPGGGAPNGNTATNKPGE